MRPIATKRLMIRPLAIADAGFIMRLFNEPSWIEFIGDKQIHSMDNARSYLEDSTFPMYQKYGIGLCLVQLRDCGEPVGLCGLIKRETLKDVDLGYALLPEYWGMGYALEAARAVVAQGMNSHKFKRIVAITLEHNTRCINLLTKLGFKLENERIIDQGDPLLLYSISHPSHSGQ